MYAKTHLMTVALFQRTVTCVTDNFT